jgi:hypothetical protein
MRYSENARARINVRLAPAVIAVAAALLSGCSSGEEDLTPTFAEQATNTATAEGAGVEDVDPADYMLNGNVVFDYRTGGDETGLCIIEADDAAPDAVTCTGTAPDDAPDIEVPPFGQQRPGAARITDEGITYTLVEGIPSAPGALEPDQRITVGEASCEIGGDRELRCAVGKTVLTVSGEDRTMTLTGDVLDDAYHVDPGAPAPTTGQDAPPAGIDGDYSDTDEPVAAGTMCGAASGNTLVKVREGSVSCLDAQEVIDDYRERRDAEGGGNTLAMRIGEWDCSSPTAGRSTQLDAAEICYGPSGTVIATPAGSGQL